MRRIALVLVAVAAFACTGASTAVAGHHHHGYAQRAGHHGYYRHYGNGWAGPGYRYGAGYRGFGGWYGAGATYGYGGGIYPYAYPQPGFGVATRNFSLWLGQ